MLRTTLSPIQLPKDALQSPFREVAADTCLRVIRRLELFLDHVARYLLERLACHNLGGDSKAEKYFGVIAYLLFALTPENETSCANAQMVA